MKINPKKSNILLFNMSHKYRFPAEISVSTNEVLEVVRSAKILGVLVTDDLKRTSNTDFIVEKARNKIWTLRKLSKLGFGTDFILDVYYKEIRSLLEYCVPVWSGSLSFKDSNKIENIQKLVMKILIKGSYTSYSETCEFFQVEKLYRRREKLCLNFGHKEIKKDNSIFKKSTQKSKRKQTQKLVSVPNARTKRNSSSSVPYISRLINSNMK